MSTEQTELKIISMSEIRQEVKDIAIAWHESATNWIGDKVKLASDIQNYADKYANECIRRSQLEKKEEKWVKIEYMRPKKDADILAFDGIDIFICTGTTNENLIESNVTHWMPLPTAPTENTK